MISPIAFMLFYIPIWLLFYFLLNLHTESTTDSMIMKKEPSIGIFNDSFPPIYDGVTLTVQNYCRYLSESGNKVTVVTPWNPIKVDSDGLYDIIRFFSLPIRSRKPYRYGYPKIDPYIWRKLRSTPFSLVHCHAPFSTGRLGVYVKKKQGVPLIGTFHSKYRQDLEHSLRHIPFMVDIVMKRILDFFNSCDEVWIPQAQVEPTVREYGYKGQLTVVENGSDIGYFDEDIEGFKNHCRVKIGLAPDELGLLFVGQHIKEKGVDIILDVLKLLKGKIKFKMNFIGIGYALDEMKRKVEMYGLSDSVTFHGAISDRERLSLYYAASDLFLFPSLYDNAPLVVREAASFATPAILVDKSTASEVVSDDYNGFLVARDSTCYADKILQLYKNRHKILGVGINARESFVRKWSDVVEEVNDRYRVILRQHSF